MDYSHFKKYLGNNKNFKIVSIRSQRPCKKCGVINAVGSECLTINPKFGSRYWICRGCVERFINVLNAKVRLDRVAFDDDGYWLVCKDSLDEAMSEFMYYDD